MNKISTCTEMFARTMDLKQTLAALDKLKLSYFDMAWRFIKPYFSALATKGFEELKGVLSEFEVKPVAIMGVTNFSVGENKISEQMDVLREHVEAAKMLGVDVIRVFAGLDPNQCIDPQNLEHITKNMQKAIPLLENTNIKLAIENHFGVTATAESVLRIIDGVGSSCFGVTFDPANFVVSGEDPVKACAVLADRISHVHLKDCVYTGTGKWAGYEFVALGKGILDYHAIISNLQNNGYNGYLSLEYECPEDVEHGTMVARTNLESLLNQFK